MSKRIILPQGKRNFSVFSANENFTSRYTEEREHQYRQKFERDRDRIFFSRAFRRLSGKSQLFVAGYDELARTRQLHTLEVFQIAKAIAKRLNLNETLCEAIALGHDLGHTPFGHVGERTLNYIMNNCDLLREYDCELNLEDRGFKHNWQSLRVATEIEQIRPRYPGLNLTDATLWGILHHSSLSWKYCEKRNFRGHCNIKKTVHKKQCDVNISILPERIYYLDYEMTIKPDLDETSDNLFRKHYRRDKDFMLLDSQIDGSDQEKLILALYDIGYIRELNIHYYKRGLKYVPKEAWSVEALIANWADEISQRHHDVEDGILANIIDKNDLIDTFSSIFSDYTHGFKKLINTAKNEIDPEYFMPALSSLIVGFYTDKFIEDVGNNLLQLKNYYRINNKQDFQHAKKAILNDHPKFKFASYSDDFLVQERKFNDYLNDRILNCHMTQCMDAKANYVIRHLFKAYLINPQQLPDKTILTLYRELEQERGSKNVFKNFDSLPKIMGELRKRLNNDHFRRYDQADYKKILVRVISDFISGMTDKHALGLYEQLYGPKA